MLRWMITVLLRLAPDVEDRDLEEIGTEDDLKGALGGGEILMESTSQEIKTRAGRLAEDLRTYSKVIIVMVMVMIIMMMVVMMVVMINLVPRRFVIDNINPRSPRKATQAMAPGYEAE